MKIIFRGRNRKSAHTALPTAGDYIELLENSWDDYGYKTTFGVNARLNGRDLQLDSVKLLIDNERNSAAYLHKQLERGWDGLFPLRNLNYISNPIDLPFYDEIIATVGRDTALEVAKKLRDASYLVRIEGDEDAIALIQSTGFRNSLQRERGAKKAFQDGWRVLRGEDFGVADLAFRFRDLHGEVATLNLQFAARGPLPSDINVLIGPNGIGKTQLLRQFTDLWIDDGRARDQEVGFLEGTTNSRLIVVSYSPFEDFPIDLRKHKLLDQNAYQYFGFRGRSKSQKSAKRIIRSSPAVARESSALSLLDCAVDDIRFRALPDWGRKLATMKEVLEVAFHYDYAAVVVPPHIDDDEIFDAAIFLDWPIVEKTAIDGSIVGRYIPITAGNPAGLRAHALRDIVRAKDGVTFFKDGKPLHLSSGQKMFSYVVVNVLGAIRRDSLVIIDEPELFLHLTLEIRFIKMLKQILATFSSKALIATHSEVTVREIPAACVHVMQSSAEGLTITQPPFQTFGADVQRISSYVFGDNNVGKPFEQWIDEQLGRTDAESLIGELEGELNEELIMHIRMRGRD